jgi:hypothetical protein
LKRLLLIYKNNLIISFLIFILTAWAVSATIMGINKKDKTILIKVSNEDVSVIDNLNPQEELLQERAFLRRFILLMYNYDPLSFETNVNKASFILTDDFWRKTQSEMTQAKESIVQKKITQTSAIEKLSRISENNFELIAQTSITKDGDLVDHKIRIKISIQKTKRTLENPWGMEISNAVEERIL